MRLRFFVDHCVPYEVTRLLTSRGHQAWSAYAAHLDRASDPELVAYANDKRAILVTTNRNCATTAREMALASTIWLNVIEPEAGMTMTRALAWLEDNRLPNGRVLRLTKTGTPRVLAPRRR